MREEEFKKIKLKSREFKFTSMNYICSEDVDNYDVVLENENIILVLGYNREAKINEYHWAVNKAKYLIDQLRDKKDFLITFIPREFIKSFEEIGVEVRNAWHDYFIDDLKDTKSLDKFELLNMGRSEEAAKITMMCKNQSRGFTGQTVLWVQEWLNNTEASGVGANSKNNAVIIEKNMHDEIIGIVCVATYEHTNKAGSYLWVRELAVNPEYQNKGIGRKLLMKAFAYGKKYGATESYLAVDEDNAAAIHLYESVGYKAGKEESEIDMIKKR